MTTLLQRYIRPPSTLGLTLESSRLVAVVVRRDNGRTRLLQSLTVPLGSESVLENPEKAGRELAAQLQAAGIREQRCTVCLPPGWALTVPVALPTLAGEDLRSFLELRAEREFPLPPSELHLAHSVFELPDGKSQATLAAMPAKRFDAVQRMLTAAGCRAASISLGIDHCLEDPWAAGSIHFLPNSSHLDLVICAGGGVAALRSLTGSPLSSSQPEAFDVESLRRELRVTLGRLPDVVRHQIRQARCLGPMASASQLWQVLGDPLKRIGITQLTGAAGSEDASPLLAQAEPSALPAFTAATRYLQGQPAVFEFLPPQVSKLDTFLEWSRRGRKRRQGLLLAGAMALVLVPLLWRSQVARRLEQQWTTLKPQVNQAESLQRSIRQFRPWFETAPRSLQVLEGLTSAFPEQGDVWGRSVEIRDTSQVVCSGFARSQAALMETLDRLRACPEVRDVQVQQVRGDNPIHFTFIFSWQNERQD